MSKKGKVAPRINPLASPPDLSTWAGVLDQLADPIATDKLANMDEREAKARKRTWEKAHPQKHYRGVVPELREAVRTLAEGLEVSADEVARAFLEYGILCIERGTLRLEPRPRAQRMTLYPFGGAGWAENGWTPQPPKPRQRKQKEITRWQAIVHYRIPDELHQQIKALASDYLPVGEVVSVLLKHGLESYKQGILVLNPQAKVVWNAR